MTDGSPLKNSLWNFLYRIVSSMDHSKTAWIGILRGAALAVFKEPIDALPAADNEAARAAFRERFLALPERRIYDLIEFLLTDDRAGAKEIDRKLIRRGLNAVLDAEGAPVRLLRDRLVPLVDELSLDATASAGEKLSLFDMDAARRSLESAVAYLARRPEPAAREAVREALFAVAATVREIRIRREGSPEARPPIVVGSILPVSSLLGLSEEAASGIEAVLRRAHAVSGLRESREGETAAPAGAAGAGTDFPEGLFLTVFCSSLIVFLLGKAEAAGLVVRRGV